MPPQSPRVFTGGGPMFLKNYTSDVPVSQTVHRIEQTLIRCGVSAIAKDYAPSGEVIAVTFHIKMEDQDFPVRLPVEWRKCRDAMWKEYVGMDQTSSDGTRIICNDRKRKQKVDFNEQAQKTAWKICQDWVEVQMSMIQLNQADFREVFMPYIWDGERTFFQRIQEHKFAGLLPEKVES
jgi:hypothetical protein